MANTVVKDTRIKDKREERRLLALQLEKENKEINDEKESRQQVLNKRRLIQD